MSFSTGTRIGPYAKSNHRCLKGLNAGWVLSLVPATRIAWY